MWFSLCHGVHGIFIYSLPIDIRGADSPALPLWVMCTSEANALSIYKLDRFINAIVDLRPSAMLERLRILQQSKALNSILFGTTKYYAVLEGANRIRGIFQTWWDFLLISTLSLAHLTQGRRLPALRDLCKQQLH